MATIIKRDNGYKAVQWTDGDRRRHTMSIGKVTVRASETIATHVDRLASAAAAGSALDIPRDTARWLADEVGDVLHDKLAEHGLIEPRAAATVHPLAKVISEFESKRADVKEQTRSVWSQAFASLILHFGVSRAFGSITEAHAADFEQWLIAYQRTSGKPYARATIRKRIGVAKMLWKWAAKRGYAASNVFADLRSTAVATENLHTVTLDEADAILRACPDAQWRALIALARFGGLRIPSEIKPLRWGDVSWASRTLRVTSPKTAAYDGHGERIVPLFPELHAHLLAAFEAAPEGAEFVIELPEVRRTSSAYLAKRLLAIIRAAGIAPWRRPWHSMRGTRQRELVNRLRFPEHAVNTWLGNSARVARDHYLRATPELMAEAAGVRSTLDRPRAALHGALQQRGESTGTERNEQTDDIAQTPEKQGSREAVAVFADEACSPARI